MALLDEYAKLFGQAQPQPILPKVNLAPLPAAPQPAQAQAQPQFQQQNPLDIIKALSGLVHRDPLGQVARQNAQGNQAHSIEDWKAMFAPVHTQPNYTPEQRTAALQQLRGQSGAENLNIGGGHVVQQDQVHTDLSPNIQRFPQADGSVDISYPNRLGVPQAPGHASGSITPGNITDGLGNQTQSPSGPVIPPTGPSQLATGAPPIPFNPSSVMNLFQPIPGAESAIPGYPPTSPAPEHGLPGPGKAPIEPNFDLAIPGLPRPGSAPISQPQAQAPTSVGGRQFVNQQMAQLQQQLRMQALMKQYGF